MFSIYFCASFQPKYLLLSRKGGGGGLGKGALAFQPLVFLWQKLNTAGLPVSGGDNFLGHVLTGKYFNRRHGMLKEAQKNKLFWLFSATQSLSLASDESRSVFSGHESVLCYASAVSHFSSWVWLLQFEIWLCVYSTAIGWARLLQTWLASPWLMIWSQMELLLVCIIPER